MFYRGGMETIASDIDPENMKAAIIKELVRGGVMTKNSLGFGVRYAMNLLKLRRTMLYMRLLWLMLLKKYMVTYMWNIMLRTLVSKC